MNTLVDVTGLDLCKSKDPVRDVEVWKINLAMVALLFNCNKVITKVRMPQPCNYISISCSVEV